MLPDFVRECCSFALFCRLIPLPPRLSAPIIGELSMLLPPETTSSRNVTPLAAQSLEKRVERSSCTHRGCGDQQHVKMKRNSCGGNEFSHPFCRKRGRKRCSAFLSHFGNIDLEDNKVHLESLCHAGKDGMRLPLRREIGSPAEEKKYNI